jgi:ABC-2 type transport system permease protein
VAPLVASEVLLTLNAATVVAPYLPTRYWLGWIDFFRQPISGVISGAGSAFRKVYVVVFLAAWANFATKRRVTDTKMALMKVVS